MTHNNSTYRPQRQHADDAGCDLRTIDSVAVEPFSVRVIATGYCPQQGDIPEGSVGLVFARSSLHLRGLSPANGVGVIDSGYQGEVLLALFNDTGVPAVLDRGERIAQIVVVPLNLSSALYATTAYDPQQLKIDNQPRGTEGFGSTGRF